MPTILFPRSLRQFTAGKATYDSDTVCFKALLDETFTLYPRLAQAVMLPTGEIQPFVGLFVSGRRVPQEDIEALSIDRDAEVAIVSAVAGG